MTIPPGATNIVKLPLAFVRSGWVNVGSGAVWGVGNNGYGWSRTALSATIAYLLYLSPTNVDPSVSGDRWVGRSLRCLYLILNYLTKLILLTSPY